MNYDKLGIKHPFSQPWQELIAQWKRVCSQLLHGISYQNTASNGFHVLRDPDILRALACYLNNKSSNNKTELLEMLTFLKDTLISVRVLSIGRGCPEDNAVLCLPSAQDLEDRTKSKDDKYCTYLGPLEPAHKGLKKDFPFIYKNHDLLQHDVLYIGANTRWILGYVQNGRYCLADGKGGGIAFLSTSALYYMLQTSTVRNVILFRNTNTLQYRFCEIKVLI